jgi:hypothetical protein
MLVNFAPSPVKLGFDPTEFITVDYGIFQKLQKAVSYQKNISLHSLFLN